MNDRELRIAAFCALAEIKEICLCDQYNNQKIQAIENVIRKTNDKCWDIINKSESEVKK